MIFLLAGAYAFITSYILVGMVRYYAMHVNMFDVPGERSSHSTVTPRGGGIAIVVVVLSFLIYQTVIGVGHKELLIALLGAGSLVGFIGFIDDHQNISPILRFVVHVLSALWIVYWIGGIKSVVSFGFELNLGGVGILISVFFITWMINLYNFMDGIDGIAGIETITIALSGIILHCLLVGASENLLYLIMLGLSTLGFLFWNIPKAKIFLGDSGSGFIGVFLAALVIHYANVSYEFIWAWLILLAVFITDATLAVIRRLIRHQKVYEGHKSHAYQFASRKYGSHLYVSVTVGLINLLWLLPIAVLVGYSVLDGMLGLILAYSPVIFLALLYKSGASEQQ